MKNILSENMQRFGTKNLTESAKKKLIVKSIMETINQHGLQEAVKSALNEEVSIKAAADKVRAQYFSPDVLFGIDNQNRFFIKTPTDKGIAAGIMGSRGIGVANTDKFHEYMLARKDMYLGGPRGRGLNGMAMTAMTLISQMVGAAVKANASMTPQ